MRSEEARNCQGLRSLYCTLSWRKAYEPALAGQHWRQAGRCRGTTLFFSYRAKVGAVGSACASSAVSRVRSLMHHPPLGGVPQRTDGKGYTSRFLRAEDWYPESRMLCLPAYLPENPRRRGNSDWRPAEADASLGRQDDHEPLRYCVQKSQTRPIRWWPADRRLRA